jgi:hypothetical protein
LIIPPTKIDIKEFGIELTGPDYILNKLKKDCNK